MEEAVAVEAQVVRVVRVLALLEQEQQVLPVALVLVPLVQAVRQARLLQPERVLEVPRQDRAETGQRLPQTTVTVIKVMVRGTMPTSPTFVHRTSY